jgi:hypothetical protein
LLSHFLGLTVLFGIATGDWAGSLVKYLDEEAGLIEDPSAEQLLYYKLAIQFGAGLVGACAVMWATWRPVYAKLPRPVPGAWWALAGVLVKLVAAAILAGSYFIKPMAWLTAPMSYVHSHAFDTILSMLCISIGLSLAYTAAGRLAADQKMHDGD